MKSLFRHNFIRVLVFFVAAALLIAGLNVLFTPKWSTTFRSGTTIRSLYDQPRDSIDVLILGPSNAICGINANEFFREYGMAAYSAATESQPIAGSYFLLVDTLRRQDIRAVILDLSMLFDDTQEPDYRKVFDYMPLTGQKLQLLREYHSIMPEMDFASYLLPLIQYHSRYDELSTEDITRDGPALRGFFVRDEIYEGPEPGLTPDPEREPFEVGETEQTYFRKIAELCEQEGITLLLTSCPAKIFTNPMHNAARALADEYGLTYLDFSMPDVWPLDNYTGLMADSAHLNRWGAAVVTEALGAELLTECALPDRSEDAYQLALDEEYEQALQEANQ